jgi:hypothetical protein
MRAIPVILFLLACPPVLAGGYVVLTTVGEDSPYHPAAEQLAKLHDASVLRLDPADPEALLPALSRLSPEYVALVMLPKEIEFEFQRRFLAMATRLDDDPFVDFSYGYVTGADGADATALVLAGRKVSKRPRPPTFGRLAGGGERSFRADQPYRLSSSTLPAVRGYVKGDGEEHDREFVAGFLPELSRCNVIQFVGHGYPDRVAGGLDAKDLVGLRLDGAVVLNIACYTGVTGTWYQRDRLRIHRLKVVPPEKSFALALLKTGVSGYTAYLCPRPAGPELDRDLMALIVTGLSLGEARRRDYDKTVLGFLGYGEEGLALGPVADAEPPEAGIDPVRDMMLEGATGGIVYGDPAVRPFKALTGQDPLKISHEVHRDRIEVRATCPVHSLWLHLAEPTGRIGGETAMKVYARLPLTDFPVKEIAVDHLRVGKKELTSRVVWAVEEDQGKRYLHAKVMFPHVKGGTVTEGLDLAFTVRRASEPEGGRTRGGTTEEPVRKGGRPRDLAATGIDDALKKAAAPYDVSDEALKAALEATAATIGKGDVPRDKAMAALTGFESQGFRAMCALLCVGHVHYRTSDLLAATYQEGDEQHLLALAEKDLPNYAGMTVLEGLGRTGSDAAREYLVERIKKEKDPGLFTWTARGLAHLKEGKVVPPVGEQLLRFDKAWAGLERYLVEVLCTVGGVEAEEVLRRYVGDPRAKCADAARRGMGE